MRLPRRQRKEQPTMARIHRLEPENVPEEGAVGFRIFTVNNDVSARDHLPLLETSSSSSPQLLSERCTPNPDSQHKTKAKRDFALRRPTGSQERTEEKKSACYARNDRFCNRPACLPSAHVPQIPAPLLRDSAGLKPGLYISTGFTKQLAGDDHALDLARAFVNRDYARVAVHALDLRLARVPDTAMHLHGFVHHAIHHLAGVQLGL